LYFGAHELAKHTMGITVIDFFVLLLAGAVGGFLAGFLGIGGGIIYLLVFPFFLGRLGVPPALQVQFTIANSIFGIFFASLSGVVTLIRTRRFYLRETIFIGLPGVLLAIVLLQTVVHTPWYSLQAFNVVVIVLLSFLLYNTLRNANRSQRFVRERPTRPWHLLLTGITSGTVAALSGLGGGVVVIPILNSLFRMNIKKAKSISLGVIGITSLAMTLYHLAEAPEAVLLTSTWSLGYIVFAMVLPVVLGVVLFAPVGVKLSKKAPSYLISYIFACFIVIVIIRKSADFF